MAYSGTYGQTVITVQDLIDHGARNCGKLAEELTDEQVIASKRSLYFLLSSLINIGIQYWAVEKKVFGLSQDKMTYELPLGGVDVLNALYRQMSRPTPSDPSGYYSSAGGIAYEAFDNEVTTICTQTAPNGYLSVDYGTNNAVYIGSVGYLPGETGTISLIYEYSIDGITWKTLYDMGTMDVVDNEWIWQDINIGVTCQYYRARVYNGSTMVVRELFFGNNGREITMARLNRDDYTNLPNKNFTANQPYQFWFDRTIPRATIYLWPTPSDPFIQMTVWYSRQIMDVGDLNGELEIPQRWYEAIQFMLSHRMSLQLPGVDMARVQYLEAQAKEHLNAAEQEERDKSPIYFAPAIGVYTR